MAFANTATDVQILQDTADRVEVKLLRYTASANDETDVKKVDAESLSFRTFIFTSNGAANAIHENGFPAVPSVSVHDANTNNFISASVIDTLANGALVVTALTGNGAFAAGQTLVSDRVGVGSSFQIKAVATPVRQLDIESIWFSISGESTKVGLEWGGYGAPLLSTYSANNSKVLTPDVANTDPSASISAGQQILLNGVARTVNAVNSSSFTLNGANVTVANANVQLFGYTTAKLLGEGTGYYGRNALQAEIVAPDSANSDGSIYVSTYDMGAKGGYDIVLELRKSLGYAEPTIY